jgi:streptogramin lyase
MGTAVVAAALLTVELPFGAVAKATPSNRPAATTPAGRPSSPKIESWGRATLTTARANRRGHGASQASTVAATGSAQVRTSRAGQTAGHDLLSFTGAAAMRTTTATVAAGSPPLLAPRQLTALQEIAFPSTVAEGPDGAVWFADRATNTIGRVGVTGNITLYQAPGIVEPSQVAAGPDGAMWFVSPNTIGRITTLGIVTDYSTTSALGIEEPYALTAGPDGGVWFTTNTPGGSTGMVCQLTLVGAITCYSADSSNERDAITTGSDGALWFTMNYPATIGRMTTSGQLTVYTDPGIFPSHYEVLGPDRAVWFQQSNGTGEIGRIAPDGTVSDFTVPLPVGYSFGGSGGLAFDALGTLWFGMSVTSMHDPTAPPAGLLGQMTSAGTFTTYLDNNVFVPQGLATGADGAAWFADAYGGVNYAGQIGEIRAGGLGDTYSLPGPACPQDIVSGPDGNLWFTDSCNNIGNGFIGTVTPSGAFINWVGDGIENPGQIIDGPGGDLWFINRASARLPYTPASISSISPDGLVTNYYDSGGLLSSIWSITAGPDGALWFTAAGDRIGRLTTGGQVTVWNDGGAGLSDTPYPIVTPLNQNIVSGPDGALWYVGSSIGRITTDGSVTLYPLPSGLIARSITVGSDGGLWFTYSEYTTGGGDQWKLPGYSVGEMTTSGQMTNYRNPYLTQDFGNPVVNSPGEAFGNVITVGPDGVIWYLSNDGHDLIRLTTSGAFSAYNLVSLAGPYSSDTDFLGLADGPDQALWIVGTVGRIYRLGFGLLPGAPTIVSTQTLGLTVTVSFNPPAANGAPPVTSYTLFATDRADPDHPIEMIGTSSPITVSGLLPGHVYTLTVAATNSEGTGPPSAVAGPITAPTVPGLPALIDVVPTVAGIGDSAQVAFSAPQSDGGTPITAYTVAASDTTRTAVALHAVGASSPITITGLIPGDKYTFSVAATNLVGTGSPSNSIGPIEAPLPPSAPTAAPTLTVTASFGQLHLAWQTPTFPTNAAIEGYDVYLYPSTIFPKPINPALVLGDTYNISGLTNGQSYNVAVEGVNAVGHGPPSVVGVTLPCVTGHGATLAYPTAIAAVTTGNCGGYLVTNRAGQVSASGAASWLGDLSKVHLSAAIIGIEATPDGRGYWLLGADGGIFTFGDARFYGSTGNVRLNQPVVAMAATADGRGYWLVARDGGIFTFGDATFHGSTGSIRLAKPVVGMAIAPGGDGYWLVAADGGVFTFTRDGFYGSLGNQHLTAPIVAIGSSPDGRGYTLAGAGGHVYTFGDAHYYGSPPTTLVAPVVGLALNPQDTGYYLLASNGAVSPFGKTS